MYSEYVIIDLYINTHRQGGATQSSSIGATFGIYVFKDYIALFK